MRTKTALKNVIVSIGSYGFLLIIGLLVRKLLLDNFDVELIAYDGLISNIFSLMAIADLGTSGLFNYRMYQAFAEEDKARISKVISMFRVAYCLTGAIMTALCVIVFFLLPVIFEGKVHLWGYFRIMYVIYAASTIGTYFFGYWQSLLVAGQKEYKIVTIQTTLNTATQIAKVIILWTTKSYMVYLLITCGASLASNLLSAWCARKEYPDVQIVPVSLADFKKENMFREVREVFAVRVAGTIMNSTDNMIIMLLISAPAAAMYNNYCLIGGHVLTLFFKLIHPMRATVADMVNKEGKEDSYALFRTLDLCCFFFASILLVCYGVVYQPAISVIFGERFLLPYSFVIAYALQTYVNMKSQAVGQLRVSFGEYHVERVYSILGMVLNIAASLILARFWGIAGIVTGTVLSLIAFWNGYAVIVVEHFFKKSLLSFWAKELLFLFLASGEFFITYCVTKQIPYTFSGIIFRGLIGVTIPTLINIALFHRTKAFRGVADRLLLALGSKFKKQ